MSTENALHHTYIKVRGYHLDLYGHVNNARYLEFLEEARWGFTEAGGQLEWFAQSGLAFVIVNININYRRSAMMNEELDIATAMLKAGRRSAVIRQRICLKGTDTVIAEADVTFVVFDPKAESAVPMEGDLLDMFRKLPHWPEEAA